MPIDQDIIISCMKQLGYQVDEKGMCFGLSTMAEQACIAQETDKFLIRLNELAKHSGDQKEYLANLESKQLKKHHKTKTILYKAEHLFKTAKPAANVLASEVYAFYDGIVLNQSPIKSLAMLEEASQQNPTTLSSTAKLKKPNESPPNNQIMPTHESADYLDTGSLPLSDLDRVQRHRPLQTLLAPIQLNERIKNYCLCTGLFGQEDIQLQLEYLIKTFGQQPFALSIGGHQHAISILYDPKTKPKLLFFDPNQMPTMDEKKQFAAEEYEDQQKYLKQVASSIYHSFTENPPVCSIEIRAKNTAEFSEKIALLDKSSQWNQLKRQLITGKCSEIFRAAYQLRDKATCELVIDTIDRAGADVDWILRDEQEILQLVKNNLYDPSIKKNRARYAELGLDPPFVFMETKIPSSKLESTLKFDGMALAQAPAAMKEDYGIVLNAYKSNKESIKFANPKCIVKMIEHNHITLDDLMGGKLDHMTQNVDVMLAFYKKAKFTIKKANRGVIFALLRSGDVTLEYTSTTQKDNINLVMLAYIVDPNNLAYLDQHRVGNLFDLYSKYIPGTDGNLSDSEKKTFLTQNHSQIVLKLLEEKRVEWSHLPPSLQNTLIKTHKSDITNYLRTGIIQLEHLPDEHKKNNDFIAISKSSSKTSETIDVQCRLKEKLKEIKQNSDGRDEGKSFKPE